ncbi:hypothetical protein KR222_009214 [Zaprionus bogoriensis]|nr:hypothetical protein KR222_009214 [Zaprionus bogoriensis]
MTAANLVFIFALVIAITSSTGFVNFAPPVPRIMPGHYVRAPAKEGNRIILNKLNATKHGEIGANPGTGLVQPLGIGVHSTQGEKTNMESNTMYTAGNATYDMPYDTKNRTLAPGALKSAAG